MIEEISHPFRFLRSQLLWSGGTEQPRQAFEGRPWGALSGASGRSLGLQRICQSLCEWHGISVRVAGSLPQQTAVYVSNHLGYIDPIAICSLIPCAPIAKAEVGEWPILGSLGRGLNVIFVRRLDTASATRALWRAKRLLEDGINILNFPEGTTTRGEMRSFQRGIFGLAGLMNIPVVPLAISFDAPDLCWVDDHTLLGHYSAEVIGKPHTVRIQVGQPTFMRSSESAADFAARVQRWIAETRAEQAYEASGISRFADIQSGQASRAG